MLSYWKHVVQNGQSNSKSKNVRLLLDLTSEKSFIAKAISSWINLAVLRNLYLTVFAFGIDQGREEG